MSTPLASIHADRPCPPGRPASRGCGRGAFTLAELIVATIILTVIVGATTVAISGTVRSRDTATAAGQASSRAHLAAARMVADAQQALRDQDLLFAKIAIVPGGPAGRGSPGLLLFTHQNRNTRFSSDAIESDEYEVQYRLEPTGVLPGPTPPGMTLWRRSDPVPDDYYDGGGVAAPVTDGITSLGIEAFNGSQWTTVWDSDNDGYPHALRFTITATDDEGRRAVTARRVVAFDRTPPPLAPPADEESEDSGDGSSTSTTASAAGGGR